MSMLSCSLKGKTRNVNTVSYNVTRPVLVYLISGGNTPSYNVPLNNSSRPSQCTDVRWRTFHTDQAPSHGDFPASFPQLKLNIGNLPRAPNVRRFWTFIVIITLVFWKVNIRINIISITRCTKLRRNCVQYPAIIDCNNQHCLITS